MQTQMSDDQLFLERSIADYFESAWPLASAIKAASRAPDADADALVGSFMSSIAQMGWLGLGVGEQFGGCSGDCIDLGILAECAGRFIIPSQAMAAVAGIQALSLLRETETTGPDLTNAVSGKTFISIAGDTAPIRLRLGAQGHENLALTGDTPFLPHAHRADWLVVDARTPDQIQPTTLLVRQSSAVLTRQSTLGGSEYCTASWNGADLSGQAHVLIAGDCEDGPARRTRYRTLMTALYAMELTGIATALLDRTIAYVNERKQSGQAIGSRQSVQHALANVAIRRDHARLAGFRALWCLATGRPALRAARVAKIAAGDAAVLASEAAQQFWGAMGYARESGLYLWSQRTRHADASHGSRMSHLRALADAMDLADVL